MYNLLNKIKGWFSPIHTDTFGWTDDEFQSTRRWAKTQPHAKFPLHYVYSLWGYINQAGGNLKSKLRKINKFKKEKNLMENNLVTIDYIHFNTVLIKMVTIGLITQSERDALLQVAGLIKSDSGDWIQPNGNILKINE